MVSPTVDSNIMIGIVDSFYAMIGTAFFPIALNLGFPLMLGHLVLEKHENVMSLLMANGLK